ncbi:MAG: type VII secretion EssA family protein [Eubacteriaceae bacterium]|nr:type VII secretion EssA family protein [Eubacteriaceae bacterium]
MDGDSGLVLNMDVLDEQSQSYSSLTDLNGIPLFTSHYNASVEAVHNQEASSTATIHDALFTAGITGDSQEDNGVSALFTGAYQGVTVKANDTAASDTALFAPIIGILFCIFLLCMFQYYKKRRRDRRKKVDSVNDNVGKWSDAGYSGQQGTADHGRSEGAL